MNKRILYLLDTSNQYCSGAVVGPTLSSIILYTGAKVKCVSLLWSLESVYEFWKQPVVKSQCPNNARSLYTIVL